MKSCKVYEANCQTRVSLLPKFFHICLYFNIYNTLKHKCLYVIYKSDAADTNVFEKKTTKSSCSTCSGQVKKETSIFWVLDACNWIKKLYIYVYILYICDRNAVTSVRLLQIADVQHGAYTSRQLFHFIGNKIRIVYIRIIAGGHAGRIVNKLYT